MKLRRLFVLVFVLVLSVALVACGNKEKEDETFEIAVVTDVGQLNDGGFNQGTYEGAVAYATANNKTYKYYQPANGSDATDNDRIAAMRQAIENGAKVIVTPGFMQAAALGTVAKESPTVKFIFVDGPGTVTELEDDLGIRHILGRLFDAENTLYGRSAQVRVNQKYPVSVAGKGKRRIGCDGGFSLGRNGTGEHNDLFPFLHFTGDLQTKFTQGLAERRVRIGIGKKKGGNIAALT